MKFVVIRRDNIGDLVCTTPLIHALREKFPDASIYALVNSYNKPALKNNPDIDRIYAYTKTKHRNSDQSVISVIWDRLMMLWELRRERIDYVIIAGAHFLPRGLKLAKALRPRHIIGFTESGNSKSQQIDTGIPYTLDTPMHEAEDIFRLLKPLGIKGKPGPMQIYPDQALLKSVRIHFDATRPVIGIHISARKSSNRWQEEKFIQLIRRLYQENEHLQFALFWSPGDENNPHHPGDDQKAERIINSLNDIPLQPLPTYRLEELISFMDICDTMICSDGGALHIAAALGKPIVCFFGTSDASRWYPWGVPHVLLQTDSRDVADISVDQVYQAYLSLQDS
jgi:heptosyltransferase III